ncbi:C-type lectin domain family 2 member L-like isoform X2 [Ornithorhynchus anatinus]|uniref:C-type lectin domain-containing protein n=1 Tax=Ornithorhynchus anatinus TaxID=9258 RepID=A0A6I8N1V4_ORNAN|nr:C-type lectin domain family 2 member L-like isoform X2 [Ornithorhynchus anatinus]
MARRGGSRRGRGRSPGRSPGSGPAGVLLSVEETGRCGGPGDAGVPEPPEGPGMQASSVQLIPGAAGSPDKVPSGTPDEGSPLPEPWALRGPNQQPDSWTAALRDKKTWILLVGFGILFLTIIMTSQLWRNDAPAPSPAFCPVDWTPFRQSCYFFSTDGRTWDVSTGLCYVNGSFLAVLEDLQELVFIRKHTKGELWIGLRRRGEDLYWVNGTKLDPTVFPVAGLGECAYTDPTVFSTSSCSLTRSFICKRPRTT